MVESKEKPVAVDLYSGVGGLSLGFEQAGFNVIAAFDADPINTSTYKKNFPNTFVDNVDLSISTGKQLREKAGIKKVKIDILIGGPPCQGFSVIGKRDQTDPRNGLLLHFARLVTELLPSYFVLENVPGLLSGQARHFLASFLLIIRKAGYSVLLPIKILNASDFGVPQIRNRLFLIGYKRGYKKPEYPLPIKSKLSKLKKSTVRDAIADLPNVERYTSLLVEDTWNGKLGKPSPYAAILRGDITDPSEVKMSNRKVNGNGISGCKRTIHSVKTIKRFKKTKPGTYEPKSRLYRLMLKGLSPTIRAGTGPDKGSFMAARPIHPSQPRCITVREAARLHSFPDWFEFHSTKWHAFRQIGNSVPPYLAREIAKLLLFTIKTKNISKQNYGGK